MEDEGKALPENEEGDEDQGGDGRQGQEQQDPFDEFFPLHYLTPTRPSFSRIFWPLGLRMKSVNSLHPPGVGVNSCWAMVKCSKASRVPEPSSRVMRSMAWAGRPKACQLVTVPMKIRRISSMLMSVRGLAGWTMM